MTEIKTNGILETYDVSEVGITDGLVAWYPLDGNTRDYTEYRNDGTNYGATISSGLDQVCYSFDGVDDYIIVPHQDIFNLTSGLTLSAWVFLDVLGDREIISKINGSGIGSYGLWTRPEGTVEIIVDPAATGWTYARTTIATGAWYHVCGTHDGALLKLAINGAIASTSSAGPLAVTTRDIYIGSESSAYYFDGKIQDVRIYNRALSAEEIKILYELRKNKKTHFTHDNKVFIPGKFNEVY